MNKNIDRTKQIEELLETLKGDQLKAATAHKKPSFINAGAGTGKTYTVSKKLAYEFIQDEDADELSPENVLAITFTSAAASEIAARVRKETKKVSKEKAAKISAAYISTIHSVARRVLNENAFELGLDAGVEIISPRESNVILDEIITDIFKDIESGNCPISTVDADNIEVIDREIVKNLVNAIESAGVSRIEGGKVSFMSYFEPGKKYEEILEELVNDAESKILESAEDALKIEVRNKEFYDEFTGKVAAVVEQNRLDMRFGNKINSYAKAPSSKGGNIAKACKAKFTEASENLNAKAAALRTTFGMWELAKYIAQKHLEHLRSHGKMTFDMILHHAYLLQEEHPDVLDILSNNIDIAIVDEFQDTNELQYDIIKSFCGNNLSKITCVGDKQQSIYRFQNADVSVSDKAKSEIQAIDADAVANLNVNYRSHADILSFVEDIFTFESQFDATSAAESLHFDDFLPLLPGDKQDSFVDIDAPRIKAARFYAAKANQMHDAAALAAVDAIGKGKKAGIKGSIAILLPKMTYVKNYMRALSNAGIPAAIRGGKAFYTLDEIKNTMSLIAAVVDKFDDNALMMAMVRAGIPIEDFAQLKQATRMQGHNISIIQMVDEHEDDLSSLNISKPSLDFIHLLHDVADMVDENVPAADVISKLVIESGYKQVLLSDELSGKAAWANVLKLIDIARSNQKGTGCSCRKVLEGIKSEYDFAQKDNKEEVEQVPPGVLFGKEDDNVVSVMTIHASKGLEYDLVIVGPDGVGKSMSEGEIVSSHENGHALAVHLKKDHQHTDDEAVSKIVQVSKEHQSEELAEKARLLYVAFTRAKQQLVFLSGVSGEKQKGSEMWDAAWNTVCELCELDEEPASPTTRTLRKNDRPYEISVASYQAETYTDNLEDEYYSSDLSDFQRNAPMFEYADKLAYDDDVQEKRKLHSYSSITRSLCKEIDGDKIVVSSVNDMQLTERTATKAPAQYPELANVEPLQRKANNKKYARAMDWGSAFHALAAYTALTNTIPSDEMIFHQLTKNKVENAANRIEEMRTLLETWMQSNARNEILSNAKSVLSESPIFCPIEGKEDILIGYLDLLVQKDNGNILIVDYKTGYKDKDDEQVARIYDLQMKIYAYAVLSSPQNKDASVSARIVLVEKGCKVIEASDSPWKWTKDDLPKLQEEINTAISRISV